MKILVRVLRYLAIAVVVLIVCGAGYQWLAASRDAQRFPMPGERVDIGGRSLHLYCSGEGPTTVLLENGLGGNYSAWRLVQPSIAQFTHVCSYDRAGLGWSDASDRPTRAEFVADDLHHLIDAAGLRGPFVLVGWSAGGVFVRRYYHAHPHDVIGIVLVDSSHEQQNNRLGDPRDMEKNRSEGLRMIELCRSLSWLSLVRLSGAMQQMTAPLHLPGDLEAEMVAMNNRTGYCAGVAHEMAGFALDLVDPQPPAPLGDVALIVVTRGEPSSATDFPTPVSQDYLDEIDRSWFVLQEELAALSTRTSHRRAEHSGHAIPLQAPEVIVTAVRDIVDGNI